MTSEDTFKQVLSRFCSGVTIVTFKSAEGIHGITVSAFSSLSLEPPLILVCIAKSSTSHQMLLETKHFVVNILSSEQEDLCMRFANPQLSSEERFAGIALLRNGKGIPVFEGCLAHLECEKKNVFGGGDHSIFVGAVAETSFSANSAPLLYYDRGFRKLAKIAST